MHPPQFVRPCPRFLASGKCEEEGCKLQHEVVPSLMPLCVDHLQVRLGGHLSCLSGALSGINCQGRSGLQLPVWTPRLGSRPH